MRSARLCAGTGSLLAGPSRLAPGRGAAERAAQFPRHGRRARHPFPPYPLGQSRGAAADPDPRLARSEEHTSELQSLIRISYAVFCLKKKKKETIILIIFYEKHTEYT